MHGSAPKPSICRQALSPAVTPESRAGKTAAQADILNELRIDPGSLDNLLEKLDDNAVETCVLEPSLARLCQRCPDRKRNDNVVWVLGLSMRACQQTSSQWSFRIQGSFLHLREPAILAR